MVLHLAEQLDVPLRDRNQLLLAAGYAPAYGQRDLDAPEMEPVRAALDRVLARPRAVPGARDRPPLGPRRGQRAAIALLIDGVAPHLLEPPVNVLRLSLHPEGLAPRIVNLGEWRAHLLDRLGREAVISGDPALAALHEELAGYPCDEPAARPTSRRGAIAVPLRLRHDGGELSFISTVDDVRDRARRHRLGAVDRVVLPRRRARPRRSCAQWRRSPSTTIRSTRRVCSGLGSGRFQTAPIAASTSSGPTSSRTRPAATPASSSAPSVATISPRAWAVTSEPDATDRLQRVLQAALGGGEVGERVDPRGERLVRRPLAEQLGAARGQPVDLVAVDRLDERRRAWGSAGRACRCRRPPRVAIAVERRRPRPARRSSSRAAARSRSRLRRASARPGRVVAVVGPSLKWKRIPFLVTLPQAEAIPLPV